MNHRSIMLLSAFPLLFTGCSAVKYQGTFVGVQNVDRFDRRMRADENTGSGYVNFIWGIGRAVSFQIEPIAPLNGGTPLLRVAMDVRLESLFSPPAK